MLLLLGRPAFSQQMDSVRYENGYLYFHSYGQGDPVILLTGGPGASYLQLEPVAVRLGKTHRAILLEQRGTGRSQPRRYDPYTINIGTARGDVIRLMDHLRLKQAHLLGHSWGGMLAMSFAAFHPDRVRSLILVDSGPFRLDPGLGNIYSANKEARLSEEEKKARAPLMEKWQSGKATEEEAKAYLKWELVPALYDRAKVDELIPVINRGAGNPGTGSMLMQSMAQEDADIGTRLGQLTAPIYIIAGAQDPGAFVSYEIKLVAPKAELHWINQSGHFPMYEQPETFYNILKKVLPKN